MKHFILCLVSLIFVTSCTSTHNTAPKHVIQPPSTFTSMEDIPPLQNHITPQRERVPVAIMLPLTGPHQQIGQSMYDAARLALESTPNHHIRLISWDTQGRPEIARRAMDDAVNKQVKAVIGPLFSKTTEVITEKAHEHHIPVLAFTNDPSVAKAGIYTLGYNPTQQMNNMVNYATSQHINQFVALLPANMFGRTLGIQLQNAVLGHHGTLITAEFYSKSNDDLKRSVQKVHEAIMTGSMQESRHPNKKRTVLILADQDDIIKQIAHEMEEQKLDLKGLNCQVALTGQRECDLAVQHLILRASWLAGGNPNRIQRFKSAFQKRFGYEAPTMASLSYDVAALLATQLHPDDNVPAREKLKAQHGFDGINGLFRLLENGQTERYFNIIELNPDYQSLLEASPKQF